MRLDRIVNLGDFRAMARSRLPRIAFDFIDGGVHDEENMRRNREVFRRYAILPRYLVDVSARDQSVELFGRRYSSPFGISPMGLAGLFRPGADLMMASAAHDANIPFVMSSASNDSIEKASAAAPGTTWFQMYGTKDPGITDDLVRRATAARVPVLIPDGRYPYHRRTGAQRAQRIHQADADDPVDHPSGADASPMDALLSADGRLSDDGELGSLSAGRHAGSGG